MYALPADHGPALSLEEGTCEMACVGAQLPEPKSGCFPENVPVEFLCNPLPHHLRQDVCEIDAAVRPQRHKADDLAVHLGNEDGLWLQPVQPRGCLGDAWRPSVSLRLVVKGAGAAMNGLEEEPRGGLGVLVTEAADGYIARHGVLLMKVGDGEMTDMDKDFRDLLNRFTAAVEAGDGKGLAALFTEDGVYHDGFYGAFRGPEAIRRMLEEHFHRDGEGFRWEMNDPVSDGRVGYASYDFSYTSRLPESRGRTVRFSGMSCFRLEGGRIAHYDEVFDAGAALLQLGFAPERIAKFLARRSA